MRNVLIMICGGQKYYPSVRRRAQIGKIYVCQRVQVLRDIQYICRLTTRTFDSVRWGSNNVLNFTFVSGRYAVT